MATSEIYAVNCTHRKARYFGNFGCCLSSERALQTVRIREKRGENKEGKGTSQGLKTKAVKICVRNFPVSIHPLRHVKHLFPSSDYF
ncbi:Uncharacterized protein HZ326_27300 [Fusarium oxysporum f. sp. albedinis]|nr:Uncharacterized protein HZ326_27300 [Fusarium oxysporum f. sp. albedinis]